MSQNELKQDSRSVNRWCWYYALLLWTAVAICINFMLIIESDTQNVPYIDSLFFLVGVVVRFVWLYFDIRWVMEYRRKLRQNEQTFGFWFWQAIRNIKISIIYGIVAAVLFWLSYNMERTMITMLWWILILILVPFFEFILETRIMLAIDNFSQSFFTLCGHPQHNQKSALLWLGLSAVSFVLTLITTIPLPFIENMTKNGGHMVYPVVDYGIAGFAMLLVTLTALTTIYSFGRFVIALLMGLFAKTTPAKVVTPSELADSTAELSEKGNIPTTSIPQERNLRSYIDCMTTGFLTFSGRSTRWEFWRFVLFSFLLISLIKIILVMTFTQGNIHLVAQCPTIRFFFSLAAMACAVPFYIAGAAVAVRRRHDIGASGWIIGVWLILGMVVSILGYTIIPYYYPTELPSWLFRLYYTCFVAQIILGLYLLIGFIRPSEANCNKYGSLEIPVDVTKSSLSIIVPAVVFILCLVAVSSTYIVNAMAIKAMINLDMALNTPIKTVLDLVFNNKL